MVALKRPRLRVRSLESRILGARPSESMSPGVALLNGEMIKTADATWFDNGLKISIIGTPGDANYRLSFQSKKNNVWYGDILFDRHD